MAGRKRKLNGHGARRALTRRIRFWPSSPFGLHEATPQVATEETGAAPRVLQLDREERPRTAGRTVACYGGCSRRGSGGKDASITRAYAAGALALAPWLEKKKCKIIRS
jgi:hypothetical protein